MKKENYDIKTFRSVRHGVVGTTAYCRHCDFSLDSCKDKNVVGRARVHAFKTKHTVDIYRESQTEYTCYHKPPTN
jgi:hypothetical protein